MLKASRWDVTLTEVSEKNSLRRWHLRVLKNEWGVSQARRGVSVEDTRHRELVEGAAWGQETRLAGGVTWRGGEDQNRAGCLGPQVRYEALGKGRGFSRRGRGLGGKLDFSIKGMGLE